MVNIMTREVFDSAFRSGIFIGPYTYEQYQLDVERSETWLTRRTF